MTTAEIGPVCTPTGILLLMAIVVAGSWAMTGLSRVYALRLAVLDHPGDRSLHTLPMPRGGGLGIALALLAAGYWLGQQRLVPADWLWAWLGGGLLVAAVGWLDDHRPVPPGWRLLAHVVAGGWAVAWLGGLPSLQLGVALLPWGSVGTVLAVAGIVWLTNLYNFMDGIDGLAGSQAVFVGTAAGLLLCWNAAPGLAVSSFVVAAASAGFLWWNWPPARIFMGDIGSGLLGYSFAVLALASERSGSLPALIWVMLLSVFVWDATFTLMQRMLHGEPWYNPHRSHAYQRLVQQGYSHVRVTRAVLLLNLVLLLPLAWLADLRPRLLVPLFLLTVLALGSIWYRIIRQPCTG